jgi:hypothetical protein
MCGPLAQCKEQTEFLLRIFWYEIWNSVVWLVNTNVSYTLVASFFRTDYDILEDGDRNTRSHQNFEFSQFCSTLIKFMLFKRVYVSCTGVCVMYRCMCNVQVYVMYTCMCHVQVYVITLVCIMCRCMSCTGVCVMYRCMSLHLYVSCAGICHVHVYVSCTRVCVMYRCICHVHVYVSCTGVYVVYTCMCHVQVYM